jgi:hypothetical protein
MGIFGFMDIFLYHGFFFLYMISLSFTMWLQTSYNVGVFQHSLSFPCYIEGIIGPLIHFIIFYYPSKNEGIAILVANFAICDYSFQENEGIIQFSPNI